MLKKLSNWVSTRLSRNKLPKEVRADNGAWVIGSDGRLVINGAFVDQAAIKNCRVSSTHARSPLSQAPEIPMRNLYARFILWLIRPALERDRTVKEKALPTLEEVSAKIAGATLEIPAQCSQGKDRGPWGN